MPPAGQSLRCRKRAAPRCAGSQGRGVATQGPWRAAIEKIAGDYAGNHGSASNVKLLEHGLLSDQDLEQT